MALTVTDNAIRGSGTKHTAAAGPEGWSVTWLPGQVLNHDQAVTAMQLAEMLDSSEALKPNDWRWPRVNEWAGRLGLTGPGAVVRLAAADLGEWDLDDEECE